jgi:hypothetical protein
MLFTVLLVSCFTEIYCEPFKGVFLQHLHLFYDRGPLFYQYAMTAVGTPDAAVFRFYFDLALTAYTFINREITSRISLKAVLVPRPHGE